MSLQPLNVRVFHRSLLTLSPSIRFSRRIRLDTSESPLHSSTSTAPSDAVVPLSAPNQQLQRSVAVASAPGYVLKPSSAYSPSAPIGLDALPSLTYLKELAGLNKDYQRIIDVVTTYAGTDLCLLPAAERSLFQDPQLQTLFLSPLPQPIQLNSNARVIRQPSHLDCVRALGIFPSCLTFLQWLHSSSLLLVSTFKKHLTNFLPSHTVESTLDQLIFEVSPESTVDGAVVIGLMPTSYVTRIEAHSTGCAQTELSNEQRLQLCQYFKSAGFGTFSYRPGSLSFPCLLESFCYSFP